MADANSGAGRVLTGQERALKRREAEEYGEAVRDQGDIVRKCILQNDWTGAQYALDFMLAYAHNLRPIIYQLEAE